MDAHWISKRIAKIPKNFLPVSAFIKTSTFLKMAVEKMLTYMQGITRHLNIPVYPVTPEGILFSF